MDILQPFRIIKLRTKVRNNKSYIRHLKLLAIKEKRANTPNEYWAIEDMENENDRIERKIRTGTA
jgi:hypothetical protein